LPTSQHYIQREVTRIHILYSHNKKIILHNVESAYFEFPLGKNLKQHAGLQYLNSEIKMEKYSARSLSPSVVGDCFNMKLQHLEVALANVHG
jgi:hypothetical protein